jgi:formate dehydrogenase gamma subunit
LRVHIALGLVWFTVVTLVFLVDPWGLALRFLEDLRLTTQDLRWLKLRGRHELAPGAVPLPPQGAYNAGQKMFGYTVLLGSLAIGVTGVLMYVGLQGGVLGRWMVLSHLAAVGGVIAFFFVHFTMTVLLEEERPSLRAMVVGTVDSDYVRHHHEQWYDRFKEQGGQPVRDDERFGVPRAAWRLLLRIITWLRSRPEQVPGSPYAAGVGLGLVVLAAFVLMGHGLGASGLFSRLGANAVAAVAPDHVWGNDYWGPTLARGLADYWLLWSILGVAIGGFVSAALAGRIKPGIDRGALISPSTRIFLAFLGGALVGFATRFTRGCTSHQALSGGALLSAGSWVFMLSVFAGGFLTAALLRRLWR